MEFEVTDNGAGRVSLHPLWRALARHLAVGSGALVALISMLYHTPAWVAALRGGATWFAVHTCARIGLALLERAIVQDAARRMELEAETES